MTAAFDTIFAAALGVAQAAQDAVYAEGFRLEPRRKPMRRLGSGALVEDVNAESASDPTREALAFSATFLAAGAMLHAHGRSMADSTTRPVVAESPMLDAPASVAARRDDIVVRLGTGERFVVTKAVPQEHGRADIHLAEAP